MLLLLEPVWKEGGQSAAEISRYLQTAVSLVRSLLNAECSHVVSWIMENGELERARIFTEEDVYLFAIRFLETWGAGRASQESLTESYGSIYPQERYHTILSWRGEGGFFKNEEQVFAGHLIESQEWLRPVSYTHLANRRRNPVIPCFCVIFGNSNRILQFVQESGRPNFKSIFLPQLAQ